MKHLLPILFCLLPAAAAPVGEELVFDGSVLAGWAVPGAPAAGRVVATGGKLRWEYPRGPQAHLIHAVVMAGFEQLALRVRSTKPATLGIVLPDRAGTGRFKLCVLRADEWTTLGVRPGELRAAPGARPPGPPRFGLGYVLVDKTPGATGRNTVEIDEVRLRRAVYPDRRGAWAVHEDAALERDTRIDGALRVTGGATLRVTAGRLRIGGDVSVGPGALEVAGGALFVPQRFNHERKLALAGRARLSLRDLVVETRLPLSLPLDGGARLELARVGFAGGLTCPVRPGASVQLEEVTSPGEFILMPGGELRARATRGILLWLAAGSNLQGTLSLPAGARVKRFAAERGWKLSLENCRDVMWGLVSTAGSDAVIENAALRAVGLHFSGISKTALAGLCNGKPLPGGELRTPDRALRFAADARVATWNVYTSARARLTLSDSTFGEAITFGDSGMEISDSVCDGTGGYLCARDRSRLELSRCTVRCIVVARDGATVELKDCTIAGDVHAAGRATVRLKGCTLRGRVRADPTATVTRE